MEMKHFIFLLPLCVALALAKDCSDLEYQELHHKYTECTNNAYINFYENVNKIAPENLWERQRVTCEYFVVAADHCGQLLMSCHDQDTIIDLKDNIINQRLIPDGGEFSFSCPVVKQYNQRQSTREPTGNIDIRQEECTREESESTQTQMGQCAINEASKVHYALEKITDPASISDVVCDALAVIGTDCIKKLSKCFSPEDTNSMGNGLVNQYFSFFLQITEGKIDKTSIQNCGTDDATAHDTDVPKDSIVHVTNVPEDTTTQYPKEVPVETIATEDTITQEINVPHEAISQDTHIQNDTNTAQEDTITPEINVPQEATSQDIHIKNDTNTAQEDTITQEINVPHEATSHDIDIQNDTNTAQNIPTNTNTQHNSESIQLTDKPIDISAPQPTNNTDTVPQDSNVPETAPIPSTRVGENGGENERVTGTDPGGTGNVSKLTTVNIVFSMITYCLN